MHQDHVIQLWVLPVHSAGSRQGEELSLRCCLCLSPIKPGCEHPVCGALSHHPAMGCSSRRGNQGWEKGSMSPLGPRFAVAPHLLSTSCLSALCFLPSPGQGLIPGSASHSFLPLESWWRCPSLCQTLSALPCIFPHTTKGHFIPQQCWFLLLPQL